MVQIPTEGCREPIAVSLPEAARLMSLSLRKISYLVADGTLPSVKLDKRRLIRVEDLHRFVAEHMTGPAA